jgi:tetratricopeptide (TPR) repeat protein
MTNPPDELARLLAELERAELVARAAGPEWTYLFRHALTQETAYNSLLRKRRREVHRLIGQAYEQVYAGRLEEHAALLAHHYGEAGDEAKTLHYSALAGEAAARMYAASEAVEHYTRALQIARRALEDEETSTRAEEGLHLDAAEGIPMVGRLYLGRGRALELAGRWPEALHNYEELAGLGEQRREEALELAALLARARIYATPNPAHNTASAEAALERALLLARARHDVAAQSETLWIAMLAYSFGGQPRRAIQAGEEALALSRALGSQEQTAFILNGLFMAYWPIGEPERARRVLDEARSLWQNLGNLLMLAENHTRLGLLQFAGGRYREAIASSDEALRVAQSISHLWGQANSRAMVGHSYLELGEPERAVAAMEEALALGRASGHPAVLGGTRADLGWVLALQGSRDRSLALAQEAVAFASATYAPLLPWTLAQLGRVHLLSGDMAAAEAAVQKSQAIVNPEGSFHAPIWVGLAGSELALAQGRPEVAQTQAQELLVYLKRGGWRTYQPDALYLQARAAAGQGQVVQARDLLRRARQSAQELGSARSLALISTPIAGVDAGE